MWKFVSQSDSGQHPLLTTLSGFLGRQTWEYDGSAGSKAERAQVDQLRAHFTANRLTQQHSSDELLRMQTAGNRKSGPFAVHDEEVASVSGRMATRSSPAKAPKPIPSAAPSEETIKQSLRNGVSFFESLQVDDGHWPADYGGPMFLMPGLVITLYVTGVIDTVLSPQHKAEMIRYLRNHINEDGGFGLHIEGHSTMFGTALNYVTLRILGVDADDAACLGARNWIQSHGGVTYITSWGKFWLAVLGVYSWDGMNPTPPEMWLLPHSKWTGVGLVHPGRFWCHCRMVYLPMSYVYGKRGTCAPTKLTTALRDELYAQPYGKIDWNAARNQCAAEDLYYPHPKVQDVIWWTLYKAERVLLGSRLRKAALEEAMRHIHYEDENTRYIDIGPVNKALNMLSCWFEDPESEAFKRHLPRVYDYLWLAEDGMKMQGYNGSQNWDATFAVQAIAAAGPDLCDEFAGCLRRAHAYVDGCQVRSDAEPPLHKWYRHISKGAWPFSTPDHGWPISDCSSEGLKAALALARLDPRKVGAAIPAQRLHDCVNVILSYQNRSGGWATYENSRTFGWLEIINPSETFGDIMIDYDYVECSSACITALAEFRRDHPDHRTAEVNKSINKGIDFIKSIQRPDGSWYGSWAVCFTYGIWFGCEALAAVGQHVGNSDEARRACQFLLSMQREDGGWAESYLSSQDKVYSQLPGSTSHIVNTSWALLSLLAVRYEDRVPLDKAARFLVRMQERSGDWPQQNIMGVFNRNCMISYSNYRNIFPIWALGAYRSRLLKGVNGSSH